MTAQFYSVQSSKVDCKHTDDFLNTLVLSISDKYNSTGYAFMGCSFTGEIERCIMKYPTVVQGEYSLSDTIRQDWINASVGLKSGDLLFIDDKLCEISIFGNYSDCGRFTEVVGGVTAADFVKSVILSENPDYTGNGIEPVPLHGIINAIMKAQGFTVEDVIARMA